MTTTSSLAPLFIAGEWLRPTQLATSAVFNPSTGETIAQTPLAGVAEVDAAVSAAHAAFPGWWQTPAIERARVLFRYRELLLSHFDEIAALISREHGKTRAEARGDLQRGIEVVEFATGVPTLLFGDTLENVARGIDCETLRQPLGVCVGITPFNFPAMVPMWMFPIALACGNTFVLKPSEKVPLTAVRIVELLAEAGLPKGVLNLVHGGRDCVD
ncbi:MAG TPA: aldehyde dehydrogenase family protein, partial [Opitutus sp.]|nr:aldehyde dehydrogenase family protein [Opitutus sp.]